MSFNHSAKRITIFLILLQISQSVLYGQRKPVSAPSPRKQAGLTTTSKSKILDSVLAELLNLSPLVAESEDQDLSKLTVKEVSGRSFQPADDAPDNELLRYWRSKGYKQLKKKEQPTEFVKQRLLEIGLETPEALKDLLPLMPDTEACRIRPLICSGLHCCRIAASMSSHVAREIRALLVPCRRPCASSMAFFGR